jgi:squalene-hopene/tetraprenyl-beta-curcumene cyclase
MIATDLADRVELAYQTALAALLAERHPDGHWVGELSTSALSTGTAVSALALVQKYSPDAARHDDLIAGGMRWLATHQNADGGWGDTDKSLSNISTTLLCRAAFHLTGTAAGHGDCLRLAEAWLTERYGSTPEQHAEAVRARYGKDRTFSVPILMTSALAGLTSWHEVPPLPFELACFPQSWFRFLQLPVVSYALPALIALGQAIYHHRPPWNPVMRLIRAMSRKRSLAVLQKIQPSSGGFLEATPLTSFVTLALASIGQARHPVASNGVQFLVNSVRPDGSWPIDTNLSTWVTTLSVNALTAAGELAALDRKEQLIDWLLRQQYRERHPYTGAKPGAWAWTPLPGGVPDADDTPGAVLALFHLRVAMLGGGPELVEAIGRHLQVRDLTDGGAGAIQDAALTQALLWLCELQNRDGGWPTFCRGWGNLPFDCSGSDLTAHVLRALRHWINGRWEVDWVFDHGLAYLVRNQRPDGSWLPLWFGNQYAPNDENPTYGTARVLAIYRDLAMMRTPEPARHDVALKTSEPARRGVAWLLSVQNADGGWGGAKDVPSSLEETALAVEVLLDAGPDAEPAVNRGLAWLVQQVEAGRLYSPTPIGFYFAKLWYYEKLYPIIFSVAALGRARRKLALPRHEQAREGST